MSAALTAKVLARRGHSTAGDAVSLLRYLSKKAEREFVSEFIDSLENRDIAQYLAVWRGTDGLDKLHREAMRRVLGLEIDLRNILWIFRLKRFYEIFGDTTYGFLVPIRYRLSADVFTRMVACKDVDSFKQELLGTMYGGFGMTERELAHKVTAKYRAEGRRSYVALLCGYLYSVGT